MNTEFDTLFNDLLHELIDMNYLCDDILETLTTTQPENLS